MLSPQQLAKQTGGLNDGFYVGADHSVLTFGGFKRRINYNASNKLPIFASFPGVEKFRAYSATLVGDGTAMDPLSFNQRQLLHWHCRLADINFRTIQQYSRRSLLPKDLSKVHPEEYPICACCQFAKQKKTSVPQPTEQSPLIGSNSERPGNVVSIDIIHSPIRGLIPISKGKTIKDKYQIACVFVDQCKKFVYVTYKHRARSRRKRLSRSTNSKKLQLLMGNEFDIIVRTMEHSTLEYLKKAWQQRDKPSIFAA